MENTDLKEVLKEEETKPGKQEKIKVHKKPMQLRDIENRSSNTNRENKIETPENMKKLLNKEKNEIFKQPWNRLDTGMKLNRLRIFSEEKAKEHKLSKDKQEELRKILAEACRSNKLNKITEINYDNNECKIVSIKNLEIKENKVLFNTNETKKVKKTTKSKTTIDRLLISKKNS
jgi:hypothetical protein